jgi:hypothetical protein
MREVAAGSLLMTSPAEEVLIFPTVAARDAVAKL